MLKPTTLYKSVKYTPGFSANLTKSLKDPSPLSFFHDVPINKCQLPSASTSTVNMIVEIPRFEQGKFEISTKIKGNPIIQDTKKDKLRFLPNLYPFTGYPVNYGAIPQTWEDPTLGVDVSFKNEKVKLFGDNDPLDVLEIGDNKNFKIGQIENVKILGCLPMIDEGELDWKILSVSNDYHLANKLNNISDVNKLMPGLLDDLKKWLKNYKLPMGKSENEFGDDGWLGPEIANEVIDKCHHRWKLLVNGQLNSQLNENKMPILDNYSLPNTPGFQNGHGSKVVGHTSYESASIPKEESIRHFYQS